MDNRQEGLELRVTIDPEEGWCVPEAKVVGTIAQWIDEVRTQKRTELPSLGQYELLQELRVYRVREIITKLEFVFRGNVIRVDKDGKLEYWPEGMLGSVGEEQLYQLLGWK